MMHAAGVGCDHFCCPRVEFGIGELAGAIVGHEQVALPSAVCTSAMSIWKQPIG